MNISCTSKSVSSYLGIGEKVKARNIKTTQLHVHTIYRNYRHVKLLFT